METGKYNSRDFLVGRVAVDWLTLTTYDRTVFNSLVEQAESYIDYNTSVSQKRMQYAGTGGQGFFFGKGKQRGDDHYMFVLSGIQAAVLAPALATSMFARLANCTRIDIQLTLPAREDARKTGDLGHAIRKSLMEGVGRVGKRPSVTIWDNESDAGDTIYIGSRSSDKFVRIYDKFGDGIKFMRYEGEFKRNVADRIWSEFVTSEAALSNWITSTIINPIRELPEFEEMIEIMESKRTSDVWIEVEPRDNERTLRWLRQQVTPAAVRLSMTDLREDLLKWLQDLREMV